MLKMSENPPMISEGYISLSQIPGRWWVAHTRARFEKAFAWDLLRRQIGYFLPMVDRITISGGKKRHVKLPLFPSYVFFCGKDEDRYTAMTTNRLCQTIEVFDQRKLVEELCSIEKAILGKAEIDSYPSIVLGQRCRIIAGAFKGLEGIVVEQGTMSRIVLQVSILGQGAMMKIESDLLEPVE
jgi:transcription antitermination factor NusG